jgi:archaellum component FlaC
MGNFANGIASIGQEMVTLLDYANSLSGVLSRAFDLRFSTLIAVDRLQETWNNIADSIERAEKNLRDLRNTQDRLTADRAIKEYFLTIAEAYGDTLRADKLRAELAETDEQLAESAQNIAQAEDEASLSLEGNTQAAIGNRRQLIGLIGNYREYVIALAASGASQEEISQAIDDARRQFIAQATQLGYSQESVEEYAEAFDDMATIVREIPRNVSIEMEANSSPALTAINEVQTGVNNLPSRVGINLIADSNPALTALTEVQEAVTALPSTTNLALTSNADSVTNAVNTLSNALSAATINAINLNSTLSQTPTGGAGGAGGAGGTVGSLTSAQRSAINADIQQLTQLINRLTADRNRIQGLMRGMPSGAARTAMQNQVNGLVNNIAQATTSRKTLQDILKRGHFAQGGFTGRGGKYDPAGIVHKGEFVVPKEFVNQSTGMPDMAFLASLQNGVRGYAQGGMVGASVSMPDAMMVELSPYDRKLLQEAGNVQLMLNGRVVAEATNSSNLVSAQRGSN